MKNINIIRTISDLKNGLPICIKFNKHSFAKEASKKFYFAKDFIHSSIEEPLVKSCFIATPELQKHGRKNLNVMLPENNEEETLLKVLKLAEIMPLLIRTDSLPSLFQNITVSSIDLIEIENFIKTFVYDLKLIASSTLSLKHAEKAEFFIFGSPFMGVQHYAIKIGNPSESPLIRLHSSCYTGDLLASLRCDCRDQLQESIKFIEQNGGGYILYIMQEGRGIGLANKIRAYQLQQKENLDTVESNLALGFLPDERNFLPAVKMLTFFNISTISLITNNPEKSEWLKKQGINVKQTINTFHAPNPHNTEYLEVKRKKMRHHYPS